MLILNRSEGDAERAGLGDAVSDGERIGARGESRGQVRHGAVVRERQHSERCRGKGHRGRKAGRAKIGSIDGDPVVCGVHGYSDDADHSFRFDGDHYSE